MIRGFLLGAGGVLVLLVILQPNPRVRIVTTASSTPPGLYWRSAGVPRRGALVLACLAPQAAEFALQRGYLSGGACPAGAEPVAKIVGALPGDTVNIEPQWVAVNGARYPNSATADRDTAGRPLPHVPWGSRCVGAGEVWLFGFNDRRSWDARYFDSTPLGNVLGNLEAITTW